MKLQNYVLGKPTFIEKDGQTYKLCTKCLEYKPMTEEYFPKRSNVKCGFDSHCKECQKEKEKNRVRVPAFNKEGLLYCKKCKQYKPIEEFYENGSNIKCRKFYSNCCKNCESERKQETRIKSYDSNVEQFFKTLLNGCKGRARRSEGQYNCDVTLDQLLQLYEQQNHKCALSGLEMTTITGSGHLLLNASVDRINPGKDYTISNIRLVCSHVNMMRSNLTDAELLEFCKAIVNTSNFNKSLEEENKKK